MFERPAPLLEAILEGTGDLVTVHDAEGRFIAANSAFANLVGVPIGDILGRRPTEVFSGPAGAVWEESARIVFASEHPTESEEALGNGLGRRWYLVRRIPYRDQETGNKGVICIGRDVTAQHIAYARLEEQERQFRDLVEGLPLAIWLVDRNYHVVFQNRTHRETFGEVRQGAICYEVVSDDGVCSGCDLGAALSGRPVRRMGWCSPRVGRIYDVLSAPCPMLDGTTGVLEVLVDVTDREVAEEQLRASQRLESLGGLAAGIAHDFNNILAGIIGYAQLGEQRSESSPELREPFRQIRAIAERGAELTRKILAFSSRQALKSAPLDVNALIEGMRPMLGSLAQGLVNIRFDFAHHLWAIVADRAQIEQVLLNLCVNAAEAMPTGGDLVILTRNVPADEMAQRCGFQGNGVEIRVCDTGVGMSSEVAARAFEPFFTTKGRGRGTGLGLAVSYGIVKQHGGTIVLESKVGAGTRARVFLPATDSTPSKIVMVPRPVHRPDRKYKGRACVVEDESAIRDLVAELLRELGFEVDLAASGDEALDMCLQAPLPYNLLLTDIAMPGMNGLELARRVQLERPETAVVFMTGCADSTLAQYGLAATEEPMLRKPFAIRDLESKIEMAMAGVYKSNVKESR